MTLGSSTARRNSVTCVDGETGISMSVISLSCELTGFCTSLAMAEGCSSEERREARQVVIWEVEFSSWPRKSIPFKKSSSSPGNSSKPEYDLRRFSLSARSGFESSNMEPSSDRGVRTGSLKASSGTSSIGYADSSELVACSEMASISSGGVMGEGLRGEGGLPSSSESENLRNVDN